MKKSYIIILCAILTIILGIIIVILIDNNNQTSNLVENPKIKLAENQNILLNEIELVTTSSTNVKTTPNTILIFKTYYKGCKHTAIRREDIPENNVNLSKEELMKEYKDWQIQDFTSKQVDFYKEQEGICDEHYVLKENKGYIAIYTTDAVGRENLKQITEIATSYLPETDQIELRNGIKVIGKDELNAALEDYE